MYAAFIIRDTQSSSTATVQTKCPIWYLRRGVAGCDDASGVSSVGAGPSRAATPHRTRVASRTNRTESARRLRIEATTNTESKPNEASVW